MNKYLFISILCSIVLFISCGKDEPDDVIGRVGQYKVNRTIMKIPAGGGSDSIRVLNWKFWYIKSIIITVNGEETQNDLYEELCTDYDGGWFTVSIPQYNPRWVVVKVDESMRNKPYELKIKMGFIPNLSPTIWLTVKKE